MIYPDILAANAFSICSGRRMGIDVKTQVYEEEHKSWFLWKGTDKAAVAVATLVFQGSSSRH